VNPFDGPPRLPGALGPSGHLDDTLSAYLDDELAPAARHEAEAHLAGCADCRAELDDVAAARRAIRVMPVHSARRPIVGAGDLGAPPPDPQAPPHDLEAPGWAGGPAPSRPANRRRRAIWAGAATVAAAVAFFLPHDPSVAPSLPSLADTHAARASITGDPLSQLAPIAVPVRFGP
jgi:anti-sigma factor RsiW